MIHGIFLVFIIFFYVFIVICLFIRLMDYVMNVAGNFAETVAKEFPHIIKIHSSKIFTLILSVYVSIIVTLLFIILSGNATNYKIIIPFILMSTFLFEFFGRISQVIDTKINFKIIESIIKRFLEGSKTSYVLSRLMIIINSLPNAFKHIIFLICFLCALFIFDSVTSVPSFILFIFVCAIPFTLLSWVYFTDRNNTNRNVRNCCVYIIITLFIFVEQYTKIENSSEISSLVLRKLSLEISDILFFIAIYVAGDRLLNYFLDDIQEFNNSSYNDRHL